MTTALHPAARPIAGSPMLTREGAALLAARAAHLRDAVLPELRPLVTGPERDERTVAEFERRTEELVRLDALLGSAGLLPEPDGEAVRIGSRVLIETQEGDQAWVRPVHPVEAVLDDERISVDSPLSRALLGAVEGDVVEVRGPSATWRCTVVELERAPAASRGRLRD